MCTCETQEGEIINNSIPAQRRGAKPADLGGALLADDGVAPLRAPGLLIVGGSGDMTAAVALVGARWANMD